jgi:uncharacterized protein YoxC
MDSSSVATVALVVLAGVSLVWTIGVWLALSEFRQLSRRLEEVLRAVDLELGPLVRETRETLQRVNAMAQGIGESNARLQDALGSFQQAGQNVRVTTEAVRTVFGSRLIPVASLMAGVRAGVKLLWRRYAHRREA